MWLSVILPLMVSNSPGLDGCRYDMYRQSHGYKREDQRALKIKVSEEIQNFYIPS